MRLSLDLLSSDQQQAVDRLYSHDATLLYAGCGIGKTIISLTAINELLRDGILKRVLIVAPLKVANNVWLQESKKWEGLEHVRMGIATGTPKQRTAMVDNQNNNVIVINFENLPWLFTRMGKAHGFDGLLIDELTKLKAVGGRQFKSLRPKLPTFMWKVGMTATPVSEDLQSLFGMCLILDNGKRLGTRKDAFLNKYFYPTDYMQYNWESRDDGSALLTVVADLIYQVPDYRHTLPPITYTNRMVKLPPDARKAYDTLAKDGLLDDVIASNAAVLSGKLLQAASGFLYRDDGPPTPLHDEKINACVQLVKQCSGPVVVCYWFTQDKERLLQAIPNAVLLGKDPATIGLWNAGKIPVLLVHPKSAGHGIQLEQGGCEMIFLTPMWSNDLTIQTIARIWRQNQTKPCQIHNIIAQDTVDELVIQRLEDKAQFDQLLRKHLNNRQPQEIMK